MDLCSGYGLRDGREPNVQDSIDVANFGPLDVPIESKKTIRPHQHQECKMAMYRRANDIIKKTRPSLGEF